MSSTTTSTSSGLGGRLPSNSSAVPTIRIDPGHPRPGAPATDDRPQTPDADLSDPPDVSLLDRTQLAQLARRLVERHHELCRQQEELNAALAEFEKRQRRSRMEEQERQLELREQEKELDERAARLTELADQLERRCAEQEAREREWNERLRASESEREAFGRREEQWREEKSQLVHAIAVLEEQLAAERSKRREHERLWQERQSREAQAAERLRQLEAIEQTLTEQTEALQEQQEAFRCRRKWWLERLEHRRRTWAAKWLEERQKLAEWKERLSQRAEELEGRAAALQQMEADLHALQADLLQRQLALETAEQRFAGALPSAEQTSLVARLRAELDAEWQWALERQQRQCEELQRLLQQIESRSLELAERRQALVQWFRKRETEQAERASELARREEEHHRQLEHLQQTLEQMEARCLRAEAQLRTWVSREYHVD